MIIYWFTDKFHLPIPPKENILDFLQGESISKAIDNWPIL